MESLSEVSEYLHNLESLLNDEVNYVERMEEIVKKEKIELETKAMITCTMRRKGLRQHNSHMTIGLFEKLGNRKFDVDKYGRRIVTNAQIKIHGYKFRMDLVMDEYEGTIEPSMVFGRDFLLATKCTMNFGLGEMQINIGELEQMLKECGDEGVEPLQPLSPIKEAKTIKSIANKFKELLEEKPIFHFLENYTYYKKMMDEVSIDKRRLEIKEKIKEEDVANIMEGGLPKKMDDPENFIMPLKVNETTSINALVDTGASVSVMASKIYKVLGLGKAGPSNDKLLMAENTIAKAYRKL
ncbi:RNA-directed DNA polymerase, eukaryota, reverse transcriptase zinc-binding domain protein [Tanacetum coccineum]